MRCGAERTGTTNQAIVLKFDLSGIAPGSVNSAKLELTAAEAITGTHDFKVWGLEHDGADWDWDESTVDFDDAPGLAFDGNSRTLGIDPRYTADGQPAEQDNQPLDTPGLYSLGEFSIGSMTAGQTTSFDSLNLAVMLNLAAYFEGQPQAGLVTLDPGADERRRARTTATFYSQEGSAFARPAIGGRRRSRGARSTRTAGRLQRRRCRRRGRLRRVAKFREHVDRQVFRGRRRRQWLCRRGRLRRLAVELWQGVE